MASDLDEEMDEESDISGDINLLLPRSRPVRFNCHGSLVAESEHDESLQNTQNDKEAGTRAETVVVRNIFFFGQFFFIVIVWLFLWSHFSCIRPNKQPCSCKTTCSRKKTARSAGCPCRNADKECSVNCGCGKGKPACKNGRLEAIERDNAQNLLASAFDRHSAEVRQSMEEIKVRFRAIKANRHLHTYILYLISRF